VVLAKQGRTKEADQIAQDLALKMGAWVMEPVAVSNVQLLAKILNVRMRWLLHWPWRYFPLPWPSFALLSFDFALLSFDFPLTFLLLSFYFPLAFLCLSFDFPLTFLCLSFPHGLNI